MYNKEDLEKALQILQNGGVILYPTDTIWGLGCDASNPEAVKKIYEIKQREDSKSMLSLVGSQGMLQQFVAEIPEAAWQLIDAAVKPLTIIYDSPRGLAQNLLAPDGSAGLRISDEEFSKALTSRLKRPVVSTSANISGKKAPSTFNEIAPEILEAVDYVVQHGRDYNAARASNIIKVTNSSVITVIR